MTIYRDGGINVPTTLDHDTEALLIRSDAPTAIKGQLEGAVRDRELADHYDDFLVDCERYSVSTW